MAVLNLGFTGMDTATEAELRRAFEQALPVAGGGWQLVADTHADYVVVDMDSMYGPMSWLRLHAAGKQVIGLTAAPRSQTPYRIGRPIDAAELATLLRDMRGPVADAEPAPVAPAPPPAAPASVPSGMTPSPQPQDQLPEELPVAATAAELPPNPDAVVEPALPAAEPPSAAVAQVLPPAPSIAPHVPSPAPPPAPAAASRSAEPDTLAEWLASGRLRGRTRFERNGASVLVDADQRHYFGPAALKPLTPLFEAAGVVQSDFEPVGADVWAAQAAALGTPQPLARLVWYGALLAGGGRIAPGYEADARFRLTKWPQTEREFPKHFRIATAMMKGPATVADVAQAAGVPEGDVADFVNASLATGFAEPHREPEPEPEAPKSGGLFGRLRGR